MPRNNAQRGSNTPATAEERYQAIKDRIAKAAKIAGRSSDDATLIAISKTYDADAILPFLEEGHHQFGENRVQEAQSKWPALKQQFPDAQLHLVGQLQSNKAEDAVALFDAIHSVDRRSLVKAIANAQQKLGRIPETFIQVNIGDEPQKGGCAIADLPALIAEARSAGLNIVGLMCIPPADLEAAPYFALMRKLTWENGLQKLSMGMSDDFETAIQTGATHVRIGSALFGRRS